MYMERVVHTGSDTVCGQLNATGARLEEDIPRSPSHGLPSLELLGGDHCTSQIFRRDYCYQTGRHE